MRGLGSIDSLSCILEGVARRLGLESKLLESRLRRNWVSIVGEPIASNTWPDQIRYKKLYLLVHNSVWLHQLTFLKPTLLHNLNGVAGGELVTDIVLRVGEIPSRAAASATTHPIDDTFPTVSEVILAEASSHVSAIHDPDLRLRFTEVISRYPQAPTPSGWDPSRVP
jgi:Dna[CI] antecedent DciA-like protein